MRKKYKAWGVWCHLERPCWLKNANGAPKRFEEKINAIIAANEMRKQLRHLYCYEVRPYIEDRAVVPS